MLCLALDIHIQSFIQTVQSGSSSYTKELREPGASLLPSYLGILLSQSIQYLPFKPNLTYNFITTQFFHIFKITILFLHSQFCMSNTKFLSKALGLYGGIAGLLYIGRHHFLIKKRCHLEMSVQARVDVNTGVFSQK